MESIPCSEPYHIKCPNPTCSSESFLDLIFVKPLFPEFAGVQDYDNFAMCSCCSTMTRSCSKEDDPIVFGEEFFEDLNKVLFYYVNNNIYIFTAGTDNLEQIKLTAEEYEKAYKKYNKMFHFM